MHFHNMTVDLFVQLEWEYTTFQRWSITLSSKWSDRKSLRYNIAMVLRRFLLWLVKGQSIKRKWSLLLLWSLQPLVLSKSIILRGHYLLTWEITMYASNINFNIISNIYYLLRFLITKIFEFCLFGPFATILDSN